MRRKKKARRLLGKGLLEMMTLTPGRTCGQCQACCWIPPIRETGKPSHEECPHQCDAGCEIYGRHPQVCRDFQCFWLSGNFDDEHRPDKIGLVVHGCTEESRRTLGVPHVFIGSGVPRHQINATPERRAVLAGLLAAGNLLIIDAPDGQRLLDIDGRRLAALSGKGPDQIRDNGSLASLLS